MIILKRLSWSNVFSYGDNNYIDLNEHTLTQIVGTNGAGKSSLPLIIEEILYSKNSKGMKKSDIPNRNTGSDSYSIGLTFEINGKDYELTMTRKSTLKVKLTENSVDISSHTSTNTLKTVSDLLGLDFKILSQLFYQNTNASLQFLTATDTNRKKFLIDLLQLLNYTKRFEVFKEAVRESSNKVAAAQATVSTVENWLASNKLEATTPLPLCEINFSTEEDEIALRNLTLDLQNINDKNRKISLNNDLISRLSKVPINEANAIEETETIKYDTELSELGAKKSELASIKKSIDKLHSLGDNCPTCEQEISSKFKEDLLSEASSTRSMLLEQISKLEDQIEEITKKNERFKRKKKIQQEWEEIVRSIDESIPSTPIDKADYEQKIKELQNSIASTQAKIRELTIENNNRIKNNAKIQVIEEQTIKFKEQLETASATLSNELEILANLEVLKKAYSTNGLVAYKLENLVKELEEQTNEYLAELSDGRFTIEFVISNDKLNVEVTDFGKVVDILALSSGELARVNTSTLLALRKLMAKNSKNSINVLFLDEVINVLDEQGKERLVEVLLKEDLNIFIVSHNWTHPLLNKLSVIKDDNGISRIER